MYHDKASMLILTQKQIISNINRYTTVMMIDAVLRTPNTRNEIPTYIFQAGNEQTQSQSSWTGKLVLDFIDQTHFIDQKHDSIYKHDKAKSQFPPNMVPIFYTLDTYCIIAYFTEIHIYKRQKHIRSWEM